MKEEHTIDYNKDCLYFTVNSLARTINEMTDKAFQKLDFSASYGHIMLLVIDHPDISIGELSRRMNLKPSTMTRLIEKLENKGYLTKEVQGRNVLISPTKEGTNLKSEILDALKSLYLSYCDILGEASAIQLTNDIYMANLKIKE